MTVYGLRSGSEATSSTVKTSSRVMVTTAPLDGEPHLDLRPDAPQELNDHSMPNSDTHFPSKDFEGDVGQQKTPDYRGFRESG